MRRCLPLTCLVVLSLCASAFAEHRLGLRLTGLAGLDTNPARDYQQANATDAMASLLLDLNAWQGGDRHQLAGSYNGAVRAFPNYLDQSVLVQAATAQASLSLGQTLGVGLLGSAKDRRGGRRDYTDLSGSGFLELVPDEHLSLRLRGGGHRFLYRPAFTASFAATELGLSVRYAFDRRNALLVSGDGGRRRFNDTRRSRDEALATDGQREDLFGAVGLGYEYRGPFRLRVDYGYAEQVSNSFGESSFRHRLTASAGFRLPWRLNLLVQGALQLTHFPDGVFLSPEIQLDEDDENHNSLSVRLVRPLTPYLEMELRAGVYQNRLPQNQLTYLREVAAVGLSLRL